MSLLINLSCGGVSNLRCCNHHLGRLRVDGDRSHRDSRERKDLNEDDYLSHGVPLCRRRK